MTLFFFHWRRLLKMSGEYNDSKEIYGDATFRDLTAVDVYYLSTQVHYRNIWRPAWFYLIVYSGA